MENAILNASWYRPPDVRSMTDEGERVWVRGGIADAWYGLVTKHGTIRFAPENVSAKYLMANGWELWFSEWGYMHASRWDIYRLPSYDGLSGVAVEVNVRGPLYEKYKALAQADYERGQRKLAEEREETARKVAEVEDRALRYTLLKERNGLKVDINDYLPEWYHIARDWLDHGAPGTLKYGGKGYH